MRPTLILSVTLIAGLFLIAGCGKKGALYLPDNSQPTQTEQAKP